MGVQTTYNYGTQKGIAGGLYDLAPHAVDTRISEAAKLYHGYGVVKGTTSGSNINLPVATSTAEKFEGLVVNGFTNQQTMDGDTYIEKGQSLGILVYGSAYGCIGTSAVPKYGETVYLIVAGDEAGKFTTSADEATKIELKAEFLSEADSNLAPIRFFNAK